MESLVTGGGGFLGGRIAEMLRGRGDNVRVLGRHDYPELRGKGIECVQGDIRDFDTVSNACRSVESVFHAAAITGIWGSRREYFETNIRGTANVIRACLVSNVSRLVYTSSPSVVIGTEDICGGNEDLPYPSRYLAAYPESKARAEQMVLDADGWEMVVESPGGDGSGATGTSIRQLRTCSLRPHLIWGPGDKHLIPRVVDDARKRRLIQVGNGRNRVDITYVDNAAHAHLLAESELAGSARCAGKAYFIGDSHPVVLWDWINELLTKMGIAPVGRTLPLGVATCVGGVLEAIHHVFPSLGEPRLTRFLALQLARSHCFAHDRAERDMGYRPIVDPETGSRRLLDWLREYDWDPGPARGHG